MIQSLNKFAFLGLATLGLSACYMGSKLNYHDVATSYTPVTVNYAASRGPILFKLHGAIMDEKDAEADLRQATRLPGWIIPTRLTSNEAEAGYALMRIIMIAHPKTGGMTDEACRTPASLAGADSGQGGIDFAVHLCLADRSLSWISAHLKRDVMTYDQPAISDFMSSLMAELLPSENPNFSPGRGCQPPDC